MKGSIQKKEVSKSQAAEQKIVVPEVKVELEPVFEVTTPAPDMEPIAKAIEKIMIPAPSIDNHFHEAERKPKKVRIDVERDGRGFIKSLICTEITDGR